MSKRELLTALRKQLARESSPYKLGLMSALQEIDAALGRHDEFVLEERASAHTSATETRTRG